MPMSMNLNSTQSMDFEFVLRFFFLNYFQLPQLTVSIVHVIFGSDSELSFSFLLKLLFLEDLEVTK